MGLVGQKQRREQLEKFYGNFNQFIIGKYQSNFSTGEICEMIFKDTGIVFTARSLQRIIKKAIPMRNQKESFKLAIDKGRVSWKLREYYNKVKRVPIKESVRFKLLTEAGFKCNLCGDRDRLTIDHILSLSNGGTNDEDNLQVLCWPCNVGKRDYNKENKKGGEYISAAL